MRSKKLIRAFVLSLFLLVTTGMRSQAPSTGEILPGQSVAGVQLGSSLAAFTAVFPKHPDADENLPPNGCGVDGYHWVDIDQGATGVYAYTRNGRIVQISVQTPRFSLQNGVKVGTSEQQIKQLYPNGQGYVLLYSGSKVNGGRDLHYRVDKGAGVAFKLGWWQSKKQRSVSGIDIFPKESTYRPDGCISPPQQWQQMK